MSWNTQSTARKAGMQTIKPLRCLKKEKKVVECLKPVGKISQVNLIHI